MYGRMDVWDWLWMDPVILFWVGVLVAGVWIAVTLATRPEGSIKGSIPTARSTTTKASRKEKPRFAGLLQSPLTDSNR